jgi:predicted GIY-YIG superfamily endonuclease
MVYLIQRARPLGTIRHQAQYYLGYCAEDRILERLAEHRAGRGSAMLRAANERGIHYDVIRTWPGGTRKLERKFKNRKNHRQLINR